jgi:hypothetical protein
MESISARITDEFLSYREEKNVTPRIHEEGVSEEVKSTFSPDIVI